MRVAHCNCIVIRDKFSLVFNCFSAVLLQTETVYSYSSHGQLFSKCTFASLGGQVYHSIFYLTFGMSSSIVFLANSYYIYRVSCRDLAIIKSPPDCKCSNITILDCDCICNFFALLLLLHNCEMSSTMGYTTILICSTRFLHE
jgi:hypothetical protein